MRWSASSLSGVFELYVDWACEPDGKSIKLKRSAATVRCPGDGLNMLAPPRLSNDGNLQNRTLNDRLSLSRCEGEQSDAGPFRMQALWIALPFGNTGSDGKLLRAVENCSVPAPFAAMAQGVVGGGCRDAMGRDFISEGLPSSLEEGVKIPQIQVQLPEKP